MTLRMTPWLERLRERAGVPLWSFARLAYPYLAFQVFGIWAPVTEEAWMLFFAIGAGLLVYLLLLAETVVATWRGRCHPVVLMLVAGGVLLPALPVSFVASGFVPIVAWSAALLVIATILLMSDGLVTAWLDSSRRYDGRRKARGRHYRWRVFLASLPHLLYALAAFFLLAAILVNAAGTAMIASSGGPAAAVASLVGMGIALLGLALLLPVVVAVGGPLLAPLSMRPLVRLQRDLMGIPSEEPPPGLASGVALAVVDLIGVAVGTLWLGATVLGSAFPGGGSTAAYLGLVPVFLLFGLRFLMADFRVLRSEQVPRAALAKGVMSAPVTAAATLAAHFGLLALLFTPALAAAGVLPLALLLGMVGPVAALAGFAGVLSITAWVTGPVILRLSLHRLELWRSLARRAT